MIYTYNELLLKYKSAYQIEKAVKNSEVYKIEKGIYSDIPSAHYLEITMKKYPYGVFTSYSAYYYHNLTDVIPKVMYLATNRNGTLIKSEKIKQSFQNACVTADLTIISLLKVSLKRLKKKLNSKL